MNLASAIYLAFSPSSIVMAGILSMIWLAKLILAYMPPQKPSNCPSPEVTLKAWDSFMNEASIGIDPLVTSSDPMLSIAMDAKAISFQLCRSAYIAFTAKVASDWVFQNCAEVVPLDFAVSRKLFLQPCETARAITKLSIADPCKIFLLFISNLCYELKCNVHTKIVGSV